MQKQTLVLASAAVLGFSALSPVASEGCDRRVVLVQRPYVQHVETRPVVTVQETVVVPAPIAVVERVAISKPARVIEVASGSKLAASFLGKESGFVFVKIGSVVASAKVIEWQPSHVVVDLPELEILNPTLAQVQIVSPGGDVKKTIDISLRPIHEELVVLPRLSSPQIQSAM